MKMKLIFNKFCLVALFLLLLSCVNSRDEKIAKRSSLLCKSEETISIRNADTLYKIPIDLGVQGIRNLLDTTSNNKLFIEYTRYINTWDSAHSDIYIVNRSNSQYLKLVILPGFSNNKTGAFEIGTIKNNLPNHIQSNLSEFVSEKGIKIGISKKELLEMLESKIYSEKSIGPYLTEVYLFYDVTKCKNSYYKYNMPFYYAKYLFENDKLMKFEFGFENP